MLWDSPKPKWNPTLAENLNIVSYILLVFLKEMTGSGPLDARYRDASVAEKAEGWNLRPEEAQPKAESRKQKLERERLRAET